MLLTRRLTFLLLLLLLKYESVGGTAGMHVGGCTSSGVGGGGPDTLVQKKDVLCCSTVPLEERRWTSRTVTLVQGLMLEQLNFPTNPLGSDPVPLIPSKTMSRITTASSPGGQGYGFCVLQGCIHAFMSCTAGKQSVRVHVHWIWNENGVVHEEEEDDDDDDNGERGRRTRMRAGTLEASGRLPPSSCCSRR